MYYLTVDEVKTLVELVLDFGDEIVSVNLKRIKKDYTIAPKIYALGAIPPYNRALKLLMCLFLQNIIHPSINTFISFFGC